MATMYESVMKFIRSKMGFDPFKITLVTEFWYISVNRNGILSTTDNISSVNCSLEVFIWDVFTGILFLFFVFFFSACTMHLFCFINFSMYEVNVKKTKHYELLFKCVKRKQGTFDCSSVLAWKDMRAGNIVSHHTFNLSPPTLKWLLLGAKVWT